LGTQTQKSKKAPERLADFKEKQEKQHFFWHKVNNVFIFYLYLHQQQQTTTNNYEKF